MEKKTIIVVGAGKGLGKHVAEKFGTEGYRVILMARNPESLDTYQQELKEKGIEVYAHTADAAVPETLTEAFDWVKQKFGIPDVLFYNVGITAPVEDSKTDAGELTRHFIVDVASAYHCFKLVCDENFIDRHGSVIFTGGGLAEYPTTGFLPLSIDKAALKAMAVALHDEMAPKGVFVGTITIYGSIGIDKFFAPSRIDGGIWELNQHRDVCEVKYAYQELDSIKKAFSRQYPWWMWIGGIAGATTVFGNAWLIPKIGVGVFVMALLVGQLLLSLLMERNGRLGAPKKSITIRQIGGIAIMLADVGLIRIG